MNILGIEGIVLAVLFDQVNGDGTRLPEGKSVVHQGGDRVLWVDLNEVRIQLLPRPGIKATFTAERRLTKIRNFSVFSAGGRTESKRQKQSLIIFHLLLFIK